MKVLVVLGKRLNNDGSFHKEMIARCEACYDLLNRKLFDIAILSGGLANSKAGITEAKAMHDYLVDKGINSQKLVLEENSTTTRQNAKYSVPIILNYGVDTAYICSSRSHINRPINNPIRLFECYFRLHKNKVKVIAMPA